MVECSSAAVDKNIKLATLEWQPYISESQKDYGYAGEVVTEAFKKSGYTVTFVFLPWARARHEAQLGNFDGYFPEYFSSTQDNNFTFSDPFPGGEVGLYKRKDTDVEYAINPQIDQIAALQALQKYTFGVVRGYTNTEQFDSAEFLSKEFGDNDEQNLKKLYKKRIDFIFIDKKTAEWILHNKYPEYESELEFLTPSFEWQALHIAFSKKAIFHQEKMAAFNSGLKILNEEGTIEEILKRHGFTPQSDQ